MNNLKQKPVWRMNMGNGVPSDYGGKTYVPSSSTPISGLSGYKDKAGLWRKTGLFDIYAYQTNRTKAAKYERVECDECKGMGASFRGTRQDLTECRDCDGKGYNLEKIL